VSAREWCGEDSPRWPSRDLLDAPLGAPIRGTTTSDCDGPSRILSRRAAIPSESSLPSSPSLLSSSSGESSLGSPLCQDFARRVSSARRSRFFFFSFFFSMSFVDCCFSADSRRLSRSTSSSFTGGFEDRASIDPYTSEDKS